MFFFLSFFNSDVCSCFGVVYILWYWHRIEPLRHTGAFWSYLSPLQHGYITQSNRALFSLGMHDPFALYMNNYPRTHPWNVFWTWFLNPNPCWAHKWCICSSWPPCILTKIWSKHTTKSMSFVSKKIFRDSILDDIRKTLLFPRELEYWADKISTFKSR